MWEKVKNYLSEKKVRWGCAGVTLCILQACATSSEPPDLRSAADIEVAQQIAENAFSGDFKIIDSRRDLLNPTSVKIGFGGWTLRGQKIHGVNAFLKTQEMKLNYLLHRDVATIFLSWGMRSFLR